MTGFTFFNCFICTDTCSRTGMATRNWVFKTEPPISESNESGGSWGGELKKEEARPLVSHHPHVTHVPTCDGRPYSICPACLSHTISASPSTHCVPAPANFFLFHTLKMATCQGHLDSLFGDTRSGTAQPNHSLCSALIRACLFEGAFLKQLPVSSFTKK